MIRINYPKTKKIRHIDDYFGTKVEDPYRWLEDDNSKETKKWVDEQNKLTNEYLEKVPFRKQIKNDLENLFNFERSSSPYQAGEYIFFNKNSGLQNQSVIYYQKGLKGKSKVFIDPNKLSKDGTVAVNLLNTSKDKKYIAYSIAESGSDWKKIKIKEVAGGKNLEDELSWIKFSGVAWKDNGFYYSRYKKPEIGKELSAQSVNQKIYYHKLGEKQENDKLIFEDEKHPLRYLYAATTEDERFLIIYISEGTHGYEVYYKDLQKDKDFKLLFKGFKNNYSIIDNDNEKLLIQTNQRAPKYKVILFDTKTKKIRDLIPEKKNLLESCWPSGGKLLTHYLKDSTSRIFVYGINGELENEIELPTLGLATGSWGNKDDKFNFYTFTSFTCPTTIYKYDLKTKKSDVFKKADFKLNPNDFEMKQGFYKSFDGTKIPMFIVYKKGVKLDGENPTYLYGYGGFNISLYPYFSPVLMYLFSKGIIYAQPTLRGGGEYGEKWHEEGMLLKKQNVFNDFIAAAEFLIKQKYTTSAKLAIAGGSNGGLLVGAAITQRPDLFKVTLPAVGVMDMLRFHKFTVGWGWVEEYGSSDEKKHFKNLYSYSPLHNIKNKTKYPATLITTADHDDRVVPAHSFKFAATLQEKNGSNNPMLIRIDTKAGHGTGKPLSKIIEEWADELSFFFYNINCKP